MWIKLDENSNIIGHLHHERLIHPEGSYSEYGYDLELPEQKLVDDLGQYCYKVVDGSLVSLTEQEVLDHPIRISQKTDSIRSQRNKLLAECDYIVMSDYPMEDKSAWQSYRQQLRDFPATITDVDSVVWPVKPE